MYHHSVCSSRRGDHYGGSSNGTNGPNGERRYNRDDSQRKIPRLNKGRHVGRAPINGGPVSNGSKENGSDKEKNQPPPVSAYM